MIESVFIDFIMAPSSMLTLFVERSYSLLANGWFFIAQGSDNL